MNKRLKYAASLFVAIFTFWLAFQSFKIISIRQLGNDEYVLPIIREELDPEYQYIVLSEVERTKDSYGHPLDSASHYRWFYAYLHDPETTPRSENSFYLGFIDLRSRTHILQKDSVLSGIIVE